MTRAMVTNLTKSSFVFLALANLHCSSATQEESTATSQLALSSAEEALCAARSTTVVANTGNIILNSNTLVDSFQSSLGSYGGSNVGSAAVVQAATTILNNGGVVQGSQQQNAPAGFAVVPVPSGSTNLPLGSSNPGSLNINNAGESITLAPGNYVAANVNVNAPGALNISPPGEVRIWVTGSLNLGGNLNVQGVPSDLAFVVTSAGWVNINNGGSFHGILYAPTSAVNVSGPVFGTVVGSSVALNSGAAVHFDESSVCANVPGGVEIDQSFTSPFNLDAGLYGNPALSAQTYTAGIDGDLVGVAIDVTALNTTFVARIQLQSVVGGAPSNVVLGETQAAQGGDLNINTMIPFPTPIPQVAGQQYAIVVNYPDAPPFVDGIINVSSWNGAFDNEYPAGTFASTFDGGTTWDNLDQGFDLHFQTFVIPN